MWQWGLVTGSDWWWAAQWWVAVGHGGRCLLLVGGVYWQWVAVTGGGWQLLVVGGSNWWLVTLGGWVAMTGLQWVVDGQSIFIFILSLCSMLLDPVPDLTPPPYKGEKKVGLKWLKMA